MSGGHFDYNQHRINYIIEELELLIKTNGDKNEWGYCRNYSPATLDKFRYTVKVLKWAYQAVHDIDWMVSDDTGEDTLAKDWKPSEIDNE